MRRLKPHLTYANVAATAALIIAVAGGTTAIAGSKAGKNTVESSSIKPYNVTARDLAGIRVVQVTGSVNAFAPCTEGERLLGGGGRTIDPQGSSRPGNKGWIVEPRTGPEDRLVLAYALCLKAKPGK